MPLGVNDHNIVARYGKINQCEHVVDDPTQREAAALSRELAELAASHGGEGARVALDAAAGNALTERRAKMEAEAEGHVEVRTVQ